MAHEGFYQVGTPATPDWFSTADRAIQDVNWSDGDVIAVLVTKENASGGAPDAPTATGLTFTLRWSQATGGTDESSCAMYTATATADGVNVDIDLSESAGAWVHGGCAWVRSGVTETGLVVVGPNLSESAFSQLVTAGADLLYGAVDWNANNPPGKSPTTGSGTSAERVDTGNGSNYGILAFDWTGVSAGTFDFGANNYTSLQVAHGAIVLPSVAVGASSQEGYRIREDGAEATPTWVAAQDTKATIDKGTTYQARAVIEETGDTTDLTDGYDWRYKLSTDSEWLAPGEGVGGDIDFVGGSYARDPNGPNISTDLSSMDSGTIADGDFALVTVMVDQDDLTAITQTAGATFTLLHYDESTAGRDRGSALFYRALDGTETTITFEGTGDTAEEQSIALSVWRGVDDTTPFDVTWSAGSHYNEGQNNSLDAPEPITTVTNKAMVVVMQTITHDDITAAGAPAGYDLRIDGTGTTLDNAQQVHASKVVTTAGTETPGDWTHTRNATVAEAQNRTVALRPGPGAAAHMDRSASADIAASGTDTTTAQLTAPAGAAGFDAGRRADDGPTESFTVDGGDYTEIEQSFEATADAVAGSTYQIKIVHDDGSDLDAYPVTIEVEIASAATFTTELYDGATLVGATVEVYDGSTLQAFDLTLHTA